MDDQFYKLFNYMNTLSLITALPIATLHSLMKINQLAIKRTIRGGCETSKETVVVCYHDGLYTIKAT